MDINYRDMSGTNGEEWDQYLATLRNIPFSEPFDLCAALLAGEFNPPADIKRFDLHARHVEVVIANVDGQVMARTVGADTWFASDIGEQERLTIDGSTYARYQNAWGVYDILDATMEEEELSLEEAASQMVEMAIPYAFK